MDKFVDRVEDESQWIDVSLDSPLTSTPINQVGSDIISSGGATWTLVVIILAAIVTIALLFGIALFIDCRTQRLKELNSCDRHSNGRHIIRSFKNKFPHFGKTREDQRRLSISLPEPTSPV